MIGMWKLFGSSNGTFRIFHERSTALLLEYKTLKNVVKCTLVLP
jgi:hypothetical protein